MGLKYESMIDKLSFFPNRFLVDAMLTMNKMECEQVLSLSSFFDGGAEYEHRWVHTVYGLGFLFMINNQIEEL